MNLPDANESERAAIACALIGGLNTACDLSESAKTEWFFDRHCETAFTVICAMVQSGKPVDLSTFAAECKSQGHDANALAVKFNAACNDLPSPASLPMHVAAIREAWQRRRLISSATKLAANAQDLTVPIAKLLSDAQTGLEIESETDSLCRDGKQSAQALIDDLERRHERGGRLTGISTGFPRLDALTDGLQKGELFVLGARPAQGKSAFGIGLACHACLTNRVPTLFVTCEMDPTAILRRAMACHTSTELNDLKRGLRTEGQFPRAATFAALLSKSPLHLLNAVSGIDANSLANTIRGYTRRHDVKLVILDYLQLVKPSGEHEKKTYGIAEICQTLKGVAVSSGVHIFALAQLSRDVDKDKARPPRISDLADSASIERFADVVGLLERRPTEEDPHAVNTTLTLAKQRDGCDGLVRLEFHGQFCQFREAQTEYVSKQDLPA